MENYAGNDVSLKESSVCVVGGTGKVIREVKVASEPEAVVRYFTELELPVCRVGSRRGRDHNGCIQGFVSQDITLSCWRRHM